MSRVHFISIIDHASGKVSRKSNTIFRHFRRSGKTFTMDHGREIGTLTEVHNYSHFWGQQ